MLPVPKQNDLTIFFISENSLMCFLFKTFLPNIYCLCQALFHVQEHDGKQDEVAAVMKLAF
jgi:hypothetical protein